MPNLTYGRYADTITLDMPGECFAGAQTVGVVAVTRLVRERGRLTDRAVSTEPIQFGDSQPDQP